MATAYDFIRIDIPCPKCGKVSLKPLKEAIANNEVVCSSCGETIDLNSEEWRTFLDETAEFYTKIIVIKRG